MSGSEGLNSSIIGGRTNMPGDVMRWFERVLKDMGDMRDRLDTSVTNLHMGYDKWGPRVDMRDEYGYGSDLDENEFTGVELGRMRNKGDRFELRGRNNFQDDVDECMGNIKMSILPFKDRSDPKAYL